MVSKIKEVVFSSTTVIVVAGVGLLYLAYTNDERQAENARQRQEVVCPSFLSIARSARDTLIVMRNEPLCNSYVLDNLQ
jgi:hypothetical protein